MGTAIPTPMVATEIGEVAFSTALLNATTCLPGADTDTLFSTLYSELHRMARRELARRMFPSSLGATTLLHEAYLDMSGRSGAAFPDQARFMGYATRVMRGLIIDHLRRGTACKRGGEFEITSLVADVMSNPTVVNELSEISDALDQLAKLEPELAQLVDLKFFCGCSFAEIAALQKLSERTVQRRWEKARIYLRHSLREEEARGAEEESCLR